MSKHLEKIMDARSGRDFAEVAQHQGAKVRKVGSYLRIDTQQGTAHIPDCNRSMPKNERNFLYGLLKSIGLILLLMGCGAIYYLTYG